jgi:hypothetical protein
MFPQRSFNVGWSDSDVIMGTGEDMRTSNGPAAPSNVLKTAIRPKTEEPVEYLNSQDVGKKAKKSVRKAASGSNAKAQVTGEDKVGKAKAVKVAKAKVEAKPKPVKEVKAKPVKEVKMNMVKDTTAKAPKAKPTKEAKPEPVKEKRVKKEPTEPRVRKAVGTTRRRSEYTNSSFVTLEALWVYRDQTMIAGQPTWNISGSHVKLEHAAESFDPSNADLRPRVWCSVSTFSQFLGV